MRAGREDQYPALVDVAADVAEGRADDCQLAAEGHGQPGAVTRHAVVGNNLLGLAQRTDPSALRASVPVGRALVDCAVHVGEHGPHQDLASRGRGHRTSEAVRSFVGREQERIVKQLAVPAASRALEHVRRAGEIRGHAFALAEDDRLANGSQAAAKVGVGGRRRARGELGVLGERSGPAADRQVEHVGGALVVTGDIRVGRGHDEAAPGNRDA